MNSCGNIMFPTYSLRRAGCKGFDVDLRGTMAGVPASPPVPSAGGQGCRKKVWNKGLPALLKKQCGGL